MAYEHGHNLMLSITLRQIEYVCAIQRHGGLTAAAEALHVSQPALSVALAQVEAHLGQDLFLRRPGGPLLATPFGRGWLERGEVQLRAMAQLLDGPTRAAPLRFALFEDLAPLILAPLLASGHAPTLEAQVLGFAALTHALRNGQADLAVTWDLGLPLDLRRILLASLPPQAILAADHRLAGRRSLDLADLAAETLVLTDQGLSVDHIRALFGKAGLRATITQRCASLELMRSFAANGLGVGISYTQPAPRQSSDGKPLVVVPIRDAGHEPVVLVLPARAPDPTDLATLQHLLAALLNATDA